MRIPVAPKPRQDGRPHPLRRRSGRFVVPLAIVAVAAVVSATLLSGGTRGSARVRSAASGEVMVRNPQPEHPAGPGTGETAGASQLSRPPGSARSSIHSRVLNNGSLSACSLISGSQVNHVMGRRLPMPVAVAVGTFEECATSWRQTSPSSARPLRIAWAIPPDPAPALAFRQVTINLPRSDAIPGLGEKAYCNSQASASKGLFILIGHHFLEVFADTCGHDIALARIALRSL